MKKPKKLYRSKLLEVDKDVKAQRTKVIVDHPDFFYSRLLKSMKDIDVPEPPKDAGGNITDSSFQWKHYKAHYWDNFDLNG